MTWGHVFLSFGIVVGGTFGALWAKEAPLRTNGIQTRLRHPFPEKTSSTWRLFWRPFRRLGAFKFKCVVVFMYLLISFGNDLGAKKLPRGRQKGASWTAFGRQVEKGKQCFRQHGNIIFKVQGVPSRVILKALRVLVPSAHLGRVLHNFEQLG